MKSPASMIAHANDFYVFVSNNVMNMSNSRSSSSSDTSLTRNEQSELEEAAKKAKAMAYCMSSSKVAPI